MTHAHGTRVRIPELTARVDEEDEDGYLNLAIEGRGFRDCLTLHKDHVEVLPPLPKQGDTVEGEVMEDLPEGTLVRDETGHVMFRTRDGWAAPNGARYRVGYNWSPRTIIYLPDAEA